MSQKDIAILIAKIIHAYDLPTKEVGYLYPADTPGNTLLRAIEGIYPYEGDGYIYMSGRSGNEYVSGNDHSLAMRANGDRPNIPFLIARYPQMQYDYYNALVTLDQGGGYVHKRWVEPHESGGTIEFRESVYLHPIADDMYLGMANYEGGTPDNGNIPYVLATLLGNYMIINQRAPDRDNRYDRLTRAMKEVVPTLSLSASDTGGYEVPYYSLWLSI